MKTEAIIIAALAGFAFWYFMREQETRTTIKFPVTASGALDTANATYAEIVAYRKAQQAGLRTAQTGSF